ncbi:MAG: hypothetical protein RLZZ293_880, partial [Pseudomonadota bacterium]
EEQLVKIADEQHATTTKQLNFFIIQIYSYD